MSTTTQILFNSPALHSLKREQLVKLCKLHSLKANGKNVELIQRLRQHAQTLPKGSPLNVAARSEDSPDIQLHRLDEEDGDGVPYRSTMPRPSEQWEVVMDSIAEDEENSQGTLSSQCTVSNNGTVGEFGIGDSRSATLSSSIDIPLPGHVLRPGIPAPANARLSLGLGLGVASTPVRQNQPTTTIRLISNPFSNADFSYGAGKNGTPQLQPFKTTFDLILDSPTPTGSVSTWPPRDPEDSGPRRPSVFASRASSTRVISNGRRSKVFIPGAFGSEEEEENDVRAGKRARMDSEVQLSVLGEQKKSEQDIRLEREHEAIRKKLEANRARRRSSAIHGGRKSGRISTGRPSILGKPKPKPSRFGFLSSAKSLVQSVWNRGKAPAPAIASNIPKPTITNVNVSTKPAASNPKMGPPPLGPKKKSSIAPAHPTTAIASGSRIPSRNRLEEGNLLKPAVPSPSSIGKGSFISTSSSGSRSRLPLPSFGSTSASKKSLQGNAGTLTSRTSSIVSGPISRNASLIGTGISSSRNSSHTAGVSSIGTRASSTRTSFTGAVSSLGTKKTFGKFSVTSRSSSTGSSSRFSSVTSRLFAPTASSLAKANGRPSPCAGVLKAVSEDHQHPPLGTITNSSALQQSGIPTPVKNQRIASSDSTTLARANSIQRSLTGRKPRISRSKVIARLALQRAASSVTGGNGGARLGPRGSNDISGRTRSSLGAKGGGMKSRASGELEGRVLLSAKKRARQSEYARRKSKVVIAPLVLDVRSTGPRPGGMDVDG